MRNFLSKAPGFAWLLSMAVLCPLWSSAQDYTEQRVGELISKLKSRDPYSRNAECDSLVALGPPAVPALGQAIEIAEEPLLSSLYKVLERIGPASVPALVAGFRKEQKAGRRVPRSAETLARMGTPAIPAILALMKDPDPWARRIAVIAAKEMGVNAKETFPALVEALKDNDASVVAYATEAIAAVERDPARAVPVLIKVLREPNPSEETAVALGSYGSAADQAIPLLLRCITPNHRPSYRVSISALMSIDPECTQTLPVFLEALSSEDERLRFQVADALIEKRLALDMALPVLGQELRHTDKHIRRHGASVAATLDPESIRALLPDLISVFEKDKSSEAIEAIGALWPDCGAGTSVIMEGLTSTDVKIVQATADAIVKAAPRSEPTRDALKKALESSTRNKLQGGRLNFALERMIEDVDLVDFSYEVIKTETKRVDTQCAEYSCRLRLNEGGEEFSLAPLITADPDKSKGRVFCEEGFDENSLRLRWIWKGRLVDVTWDTLPLGGGVNMIEAHMLLLKTELGWKRVLRHSELSHYSGGGGNHYSCRIRFKGNAQELRIELNRLLNTSSCSSEKAPMGTPEGENIFCSHYSAHEVYEYKLVDETLEFLNAKSIQDLGDSPVSIQEIAETSGISIKRLRALNPSISGEQCAGSIVLNDAVAPIPFDETEYMSHSCQ